MQKKTDYKSVSKYNKELKSTAFHFLIKVILPYLQAYLGLWPTIISLLSTLAYI